VDDLGELVSEIIAEFKILARMHTRMSFPAYSQCYTNRETNVMQSLSMLILSFDVQV
jgi:hypothetical protein